MKLDKIILKMFFLAIMFVGLCSCTDDFADLNKKPSIYAEASVDQLFVNIINSVFFNNSYFYYQSNTVRYGLQYTVEDGGASTSGSVSSSDYHFSKLYNTIVYCEQIRSQLADDEYGKQAVTHIAQSLMALRAVKEYGDIPYSEAGQARVGGSLFPKYDETQDIFTALDTELKQAVADIEAHSDSEGFDSDFDFIYRGDVTKWAKLANVLRLEIAMTLVNRDEAKAQQICSEVAASSTGIFDGSSDEFTLDIGETLPNSANSLPYSGGGDDFRGALNMEIINMMKENGDPRLSIFAIPSALSDVGISYLRQVQEDSETDVAVKDKITALFAVVDTTKKDLPVLTKGNVQEWRFIGGSPFIYDESSAEYGALYDTYHFLDWDGDEPSSQAGRLVFSYVNKKIMNPDYNGTTALTPFFEEQNANEGAGQFVLPIVPYSYMCLLLSQLDYLDIWNNPYGQDYSSWYNKGVEASIRMYDHIAINHKTNPYNWEREPQVLTDAINNYLASVDVALTGTGDWEKICLQQYLNCFHLEELGADHVLRTGIPSESSTIIRWAIRPDKMARRTALGRPTAEEDEANWLVAMNRQGFSPGVSDVITLNKERIWYDVGVPEFGNGDINK